jgi:hypothetical protein
MKILRSLYLVEISEGRHICVEAYTNTPAQGHQFVTLIIRCSCTLIQDSVKQYPAAYGADHFLEEDEVLAIAERYCKDKNISHGL